ncbi:MAG: cytochrome b [Gammaproteobacteria bacterium]|nr:cytochrome b [Gammaproteobacteria bacterium]
MAQASKYNNLQVGLHWASAGLIVFLLVSGMLVLAEIPNADPGKVDALWMHLILGGIALVLTLFRIIWRAKSVQPPHLVTGNRLLDKLGIAAHYILNLLVLLIAASGMALMILSGASEVLFFGQGVLPESFFDFPPRYVHGIGTKLLMAMVVLHVAAGLFHKFVIKDRPFKRIWFGKGE